MASGPALYVVRVEHRVSSLQLLCQQAIASALREDKDVSKLTLPPRLCSYLSTAFIPTIKVEPSPSSCPRGGGAGGEGRRGSRSRCAGVMPTPRPRQSLRGEGSSSATVRPHPRCPRGSPDVSFLTAGAVSERGGCAILMSSLPRSILTWQMPLFPLVEAGSAFLAVEYLAL